MKKTLSITLGGRIFTVEEDGYVVLDTYLKRLREHFKADASVDELLQDIEASIGEKLHEKLNKDKQVVTKEDIDAVIAVIGHVEEIASEDAAETSQSTEPVGPVPLTNKRLYRNIDDRVIAGVASGIAAYFDINPLVVRLSFFALALVNGLGILLYLILWSQD